MNDAEIREYIKLIDKDPDIEVSDYEANFFESILAHTFHLSSKQVAWAEKIIQKYSKYV